MSIWFCAQKTATTADALFAAKVRIENTENRKNFMVYSWNWKRRITPCQERSCGSAGGKLE